MAITLSLAADAFVAGVFLYTGKWSPTGAFATLLALTVGGAILHEVATARAQRRNVWLKRRACWPDFGCYLVCSRSR